MRIRRGQLLMLALLWGAAVTGASLLWPGPLKLERQGWLPRSYFQAAAPPVAEIAAPNYVSVMGSKGQARIFWQQPQAGQVHISIQVQPNRRRRIGPSESYSHDNRTD